MPVDRNMRILIVDDNQAMRRMLSDILRAVGFKNFQYAEDGRLGLAKLASDKEDYGLVLLDWDMPVMNGLQMLEAMRANPRFAEVPVIMVTAEAFGEKVLQAVQTGVTDYVVKPYTPATIYKKIGSIFGEKL
ncbi:MAG: response regulator [Thermodesulfobacteriota bacterium]